MQTSVWVPDRMLALHMGTVPIWRLRQYRHETRSAPGGVQGRAALRAGAKGETLPPSSAAGQRIFSSGNAGCKTGNTYSIPRFSNLFPEEKSLAASSCRREQSFPATQRLPWPRSLLAFLCGTRKEGPRQGSGSTCRCLSTSPERNAQTSQSKIKDFCQLSWKESQGPGCRQSTMHKADAFRNVLLC